MSLKPALNKDDEENKSSENVEPETDSKGDPIRVGVVVPQARKFGNDEDKAETEDEDATANTEFKPKNDYTLMDELMEFLEVPEERADNENRLEPILCGYFNKIMQALLQKQKGKTMEYLLLVAKGKIFDNLLCHMQHYSLASLMLHFLGMKFFLEDYSGYNNVAQQRTSLLDWDNNSDSDESENKPRTNNERTEAAAAETEARFNEMQALFDRKRHMVVKTLLGYLSKRNPDNLEKTLNANTVLQECVENEMTFKLLVNEGHLEYIINICCEGNANKQNAPYIKHLLGNII